MKLEWIICKKTVRAAFRGMVACLLAAAVFFPVQAKADIYKKRLPDDLWL